MFMTRLWTNDISLWAELQCEATKIETKKQGKNLVIDTVDSHGYSVSVY